MKRKYLPAEPPHSGAQHGSVRAAWRPHYARWSDCSKASDMTNSPLVPRPPTRKLTSCAMEKGAQFRAITYSW